MPQGKHSTMRKTPSFIFNATATGKRDQDSRLSASNVKAKASTKRDNDEIIPDSEEERDQQLSAETSKAVENGRKNEVIIISSDEDEDGLNMPGSWSVANVQRNIVSSVVAASQDSPSSSRTAKVSSKYRASRRVIESSDDEVVEDNGNEIIELADDDEESSGSSPPRSPSKPKQLHAFRSPKLALYTDSDDSDSFSPSPLPDEALLVLDDSRNKRKPFPLRNHRGKEGPSTPSTPQRATGTIFGRVNMKIAVDVQLTPVSATAMSPSRRQPRTGKKAEAAAKLERLKTYALNRFADLNEKVFDNKIPDTTKIEWNCRFTSTAGKASYRRDREGVTHSKIELAIKILDEEERIDRTLSHEMCHLASWIISAKIDEYHGPIFKGWAAKVERTCPGIVVSTTHDYEINHPWKWKCDLCSFTYGRFSKSIKTEIQGCGACKQGHLIPLFEQPAKRVRDPGTPRSGRMAASKPRDSPSVLARTASPITSGHSDDGREVVCIHGSDSESEQEDDELEFDPVESLATKMASTNLFT
ncbi:SprT-like family-domain-containing protein [Lentinula aff. detonsa]|uniref:SprT-like family-domain-containing protein n=1 Tax=Lentinula aff. detonsa TaxID=2804958 RepID=A0AA38NRD9_9AGAR|nr:SprT-like family-domain-containing protein [Lentinula aff. detonsa]